VSAARSTVSLLGRVALSVQDDGGEIGFSRGRRAELVFAYLAAEQHRVVTQDELADALWPTGLPSTWQAGLRGVITEVRRFLAEGGLDSGAVLTTVRRGYRMQFPAAVTIDLHEVRHDLRAARALLESGAAPAAAEQATRVERLTRLPFLANHDCEWADQLRRELEQMNESALELGIRAAVAAGDVETAMTAAERLVQVAPFNEAAHQLRIRIFGVAGDRSGAFRAFERCRAVLAAELGVSPSDETYAALRASVEQAHGCSSTDRVAALPARRERPRCRRRRAAPH
jgi:DNA-binding SARP family transcriptional activator